MSLINTIFIPNELWYEIINKIAENEIGYDIKYLGRLQSVSKLIGAISTNIMIQRINKNNIPLKTTGLKVEKSFTLVERYQLTSVNFSNYEFLKNEFVKKIGQNCHQITSLNLSWCNQLTDECFQYLPQSVRTFDFSGNLHVRNRYLKYLSNKIDSLYLNYCLIEKLPLDFPNSLKTLDFAGCYQLNAISLKNLPQSLQSINLMGCTLLKKQTLEMLIQKFPTIIIYH